MSIKAPIQNMNHAHVQYNNEYTSELTAVHVTTKLPQLFINSNHSNGYPISCLIMTKYSGSMQYEQLIPITFKSSHHSPQFW